MQKMKNQTLVDAVIDLAKEVDKMDPVDFSYLILDEEVAFKIAATSVIEIFMKATNEDQKLIAMASMTKLVVENMVLNLRLQERANDNTQ